MTTQKHRLALVTDNNDHYRTLLKSKQLPDLEITTALDGATILLAAPPKLAPRLDDAKDVEWVQSTYAGIDALLGESLRKDYKLTNVKGIFGQQISEYVLGYSIGYFRHFDLYKQQQQKRDWQPHTYQSMIGKRMVIFGTGAIGSHLANTVKALGIVPVGINRTGIPPRQSAFLETYHIKEAAQALKAADIIVNTLPNTPTTDGLFDEQLLSACQHALFFNVGRGQTVDSNALLFALERGHLVHAFLDVFVDEPISQECPYWSNPNITVTPHIAAISFPEQVVDIFSENYLRWRDGFQLQNVVDFERGY
jgi:phosphoglycerate dehydrogenase-like enzyme